MTSSQAALFRRSTADWARSGSAMTASHSTGSLFEVSTVAAEWWRSTTSSYRSAVSVASRAWRAKSSSYSDVGIT